MPDTKNISQLTALSEVPANDDILAAWDSSTSTTKGLVAGYARRFKVDAVVASGSISPNAEQLITLNLGTAIALTVSGSPTVGDVLIIQRLGTGAVTHVVTLSGSVTWDATNNDANFADDGDTLIAIAVSTTRWLIIYNSGVTFS